MGVTSRHFLPCSREKSLPTGFVLSLIVLSPVFISPDRELEALNQIYTSLLLEVSNKFFFCDVFWIEVELIVAAFLWQY